MDCPFCQDYGERLEEFERLCRIEFESMVAARAAALATVLKWRADAREIMAGAANPLPEKLRIMLLHMATKGHHVPIKPTRANLLRAAIAELRYSRTPWHNPYDSEYYSA